MALPPRPDAIPRMPRPPKPPAPKPPKPPALRTGVGTIPRSAVSNVSTGIVGNPLTAITNAGAPPVSPPGVPAPTPPVVVPDAVSYGHQARIDAINRRVNTLNDFFNPQREIAAVSARNALTDNQWFDRAALRPTTDNGATRYDIYGTGEGQQQRDQVTGSQGNFNARGALFSSAANRARNEIIRRISLQRARMLESAAAAQSKSISDQIAQDAQLQADLRAAAGDYEDWKAAQGGRA